MFGKDIAENFICMLTFCDGGEPAILEGLKEEESKNGGGSCFSKIIP